VSDSNEGRDRDRSYGGAERDRSDRDDRGDRSRGRDDRRRRYRSFFRKKVCRFCVGKAHIDYLDAGALRRFTTDRGKILPARMTGTCAKHQRLLGLAIKRARALALLPFVAK
jgi:small subunit ribosomal protein S18